MKKISRLIVAAVLAAFYLATILWWSAAPSDAGSAEARSRPTANRPGPDPQLPAVADPTGALMPPDSPTSPDAVERVVAQGTILDSRIEKEGKGNRWKRLRLVKTDVQPRLVRVVEQWQFDPMTGKADCLRREMFLADQLILQSRHGGNRKQLQQELQSAGMTVISTIAEGTYTVRLPTADLDSIPQALHYLAGHPDLVESAEPDGVGFGSGTPNDPFFAEQWGLQNTGLAGGTVDADVDAPEFWDIVGNTPGVVIAVLDSGLNFTHPDLLGIEWINPNEVVGDGLDNDASGKVDDVRGWDFVNNDNNPTDDHGHGSNVTGIIAANRDNNQGIAGMLKGSKILVCKILNASNSGLTSNLIAATTYARQRGVPVMNLSLQSYPFSSSLNSEFSACATAGVILSICAGNQGVNNDTTPNYPSSYPQQNIISVGNHSRNDVRWSGSFNPSNYGLASVDLFAPGRDILSPILGSSYSTYTGTSQATPFVTAVCAALKYANPSWKAAQIKSSILASAITRASYSGLCVTGGRLNAVQALSHAFRQTPTLDTDGDQYPNLFEYLAGTRIDSGLHRPEISATTNEGFLQIEMPRVIRPDASLQVEMSLDLISWSAGSVVDLSTAETLLGRLDISGLPRVFLRIKATANP